MRIVVFSEKFSKVQWDKILGDLTLPVESILLVDKIAEVDLTQIDLLVMSMDVCNVFGALNGTNIKNVPEFVANGGICWILHQEREGWDASWLPNYLRENLRIDIKYLPKMISFRKNSPQRSAYIGPWIIERDNQIFHKPNFLDETDFAEWDVDPEGFALKTTAINAITRHHGWTKIAGYEDVRTPLEDGALIMESKHGKGLYFWTQILSPGLLWHMEKSREKETWSKFIVNIFQYFDDFKKGLNHKLTAKISPWSVIAGDKATISLKLPENFIVSDLEVNIGIDNGELLSKVKCVFEQRGRNLKFNYTSNKSGTYRINVVVFDNNEKSLYANLFLKVTNGIARYRFTTHHHYCNDWATENLGQVYGSAQRWKQDAIFLASGLFYQPEDMYQIIDSKILEKCDNPRMRIFPGQEIHPHHQYGIDEGNMDESRDSRHHIATMGCDTIICDANYLESNTIKRIHDREGLAIVAHPNPTDPWWTEKKEGHICDGVCMDKGAFELWDMMLNQDKGVLYPAVRGSDSGPGEWAGGPANTAWLREPMTMKSLMKAAVNGRISFLYPESGKFETASSYIWFDINSQLMGGTVYAVDKIVINIKSKSHILFKKINIVKDGDRKFNTLDINDKNFDLSFTLDVLDDCCYYRIEVFGSSEMPDAWTNPIFVNKIEGPDHGWLYFDKDPEIIFDDDKGRFVPNTATLESVKYDGNNWDIIVFEPEEEGVLKIGGIRVKSLSIDGQKRNVIINDDDDSFSVGYKKGRHMIKIQIEEC